MGQGAVPVTELARPTGLALPTVMRHLTVLEDAKLISTVKIGRTRMCSACPETLAAIKSNSALIKHDLSQRVRLQLRKVPNLHFFIDDSLDYIEKIDRALSDKENPIEHRELLDRRRKF